MNSKNGMNWLHGYVFASFLSRKEWIKAKREAVDVYAMDTFSPNSLLYFFIFSLLVR
jgi:hypothetical protein